MEKAVTFQSAWRLFLIGWNTRRERTIFPPIAYFALVLVLMLLPMGCSENDCTCPSEYGAPRIASTFPEEGDTDIPVDTFVTVTFDEAMDPSTISTGTFTLVGPRGTVEATVSYSGRTAMLQPFTQLAGHSIYTARIDAGVTDIVGNRMGVPYAWSFTTGAAQLLLYPDIEFTIRDIGKDGTPDEYVGGGPPGRLLMAGETDEHADRAILEFPLDDIVHDEVLEAYIFITFSESSDPHVAARIEGWGFSGNGESDLTDWDTGHLTFAHDNIEINAGMTVVFPMTDTINAALGAGNTHIGFRVVVTGGPHAEITTTIESISNAPRIALIY